MKKIVKNKSKKKLLIPLGIIILAVVAAPLYVYDFNGTIFGWSNSKSSDGKSSNTTQYNPPSTDQKAAGDAIKQTSVDNTPSSSTSPTTGTEKTNTNVSITSATQADTTLQVRAQISAITNTGTCTLTLTKGSTVVTKTANVQALASTSTCEGFNIDTSELSAGTWQILLQFENDTLTGSASQTVTVT